MKSYQMHWLWQTWPLLFLEGHLFFGFHNMLFYNESNRIFKITICEYQFHYIVQLHILGRGNATYFADTDVINTKYLININYSLSLDA